MFMKGAAICAAASSLVAVTARPASAAILGVTVGDVSGGNYTLTSVSVTRGSAGTFTYLPGQLIGVDLTDVDAYQTPLLVPRGESLPASGTRATLIEDGRLDTGVINITTTNGTADRSVEVTFARPVINSDGEDILLFEIGGDDGIRWWINDDREGQSAALTTADYSNNLITGIPFTLIGYNNGGDQDINGLEELESAIGFGTGTSASGHARALGLDLSSVGVPLNDSVTSIRFQSVAGGGRLDPVLIAGLAAVREPALGDADGDGDVDDDDYAALVGGFQGGLIGWGNGDFNRDGTIDADDFSLFDFARLTTGNQSSPSVPEPSSAGLILLFGSVGLAGRRTVRAGLR